MSIQQIIKAVKSLNYENDEILALKKLCLNFEETISKRNKTIPNITNIELLNQYDFRNININTILWFISDFLNQILRNETDDSKIYFEIEQWANCIGCT